MAPRSSDPRSFNTVRHSHREERAHRRRQGRFVLLAIFTVFTLLILAGLVFLVLLGAHSCKWESRTPYISGPSTDSDGIEYVTTSLNSDRIHAGELIVVNKTHTYQFPSVNKDYANPEEFTTISSAQTIYTDANNETIYRRKEGVVIRNEVLAALDAMMQVYYQYEKDDKVQLKLAFRTYTAQEELGSATKAGYSDHHTGYLISLQDVTLGSDRLSSAQDYWLAQNSYKYGFIQRYPTGHSAHTSVTDYTNAYRYVGIPHATYMAQNGMCLEEYVEYLQTNCKYEQSHLQIAGYEVYYVPASGGEKTDVPVPSDASKFPYTVSGDNLSGFIVTVKIG